MVSSIYSSLNSIYAASFSELSRAETAQAPKFLPVDPVKRVDPYQGRDAIRQVEDQKNREKGTQQGRFNLPEERPQSLASLTGPKLILSPTEELALFAPEANLELPENDLDTLIQKAATEVQELSVGAQLSRRKQSYVAQLYAQTNDITFIGDHVLNQAA